VVPALTISCAPVAADPLPIDHHGTLLGEVCGSS